MDNATRLPSNNIYQQSRELMVSMYLIGSWRSHIVCKRCIDD
jgi:hypothetical protein